MPTLKDISLKVNSQVLKRTSCYTMRNKPAVKKTLREVGSSFFAWAIAESLMDQGKWECTGDRNNIHQVTNASLPVSSQSCHHVDLSTIKPNIVMDVTVQ